MHNLRGTLSRHFYRVFWGCCVAGIVLGTALILRPGASKPPGAPVPTHTFSEALTSTSAPATPVPSASTRAVQKGAPNTLTIPSLKVTASIEVVDDPGGELTIPRNVKHVGVWNGGGQLDGKAGTVLLAGHVNYSGVDGALAHLASIKAGALVSTTGPSGVVTQWKVTALTVVNKAALPSKLFTATGSRSLVIVTCGGPFDASIDSYEDNVIAIARPV